MNNFFLKNFFFLRIVKKLRKYHVRDSKGARRSGGFSTWRTPTELSRPAGSRVGSPSSTTSSSSSLFLYSPLRHHHRQQAHRSPFLFPSTCRRHSRRFLARSSSLLLPSLPLPSPRLPTNNHLFRLMLKVL